MNLLFHHVRKDLRHSRWLIAITWLVAACVLWLPAMPVEKRIDAFEWLPFVRYGSWVLLFLTVGRIVQLDAPLRDTAFHRSRPVSSGEWLGSKLASGLIFLLPMALLQVALILLAGLHPGFMDLTLIFAEEMIVLAVVVTLAMAIAARSKTYSGFVAVSMVFVLASIMFSAVHMYATDWLTRETRTEWSYDAEYLKLSRLLIAQITFVLLLLCALFLCIRARRSERLSSAIAGTALLTAIAWQFWPVNFVKSFTRPEAAAPRSEWPDQTKIEFAFETRRFDGNDNSKVSWGFGGYNDLYYQYFRAFTRLEGLDPNWFLFPNGYQSSLHSPAEIIAHSSKTSWADISVEAILPKIGMASPMRRPNGLSEVEIGDFFTTDIEAAGENATIAGEIHIPLKRPVVLARIPMETGASAIIGNRRITIASVFVTQDGPILYQVIAERPMINLRGARYGEPHRRIQMIAINSGRGEYLERVSAGTSNLSNGRYNLSRMDFNARNLGDREPIPPGWLDGAELIITGDEYGGTFTREFRLENLNLIDTSWKP